MFEKDRYCQMPNGYEETVRKGLSAVKRFSGQISYGNGSDREQMDRLKKNWKRRMPSLSAPVQDYPHQPDLPTAANGSSAISLILR